MFVAEEGVVRASVSAFVYSCVALERQQRALPLQRM